MFFPKMQRKFLSIQTYFSLKIKKIFQKMVFQKDENGRRGVENIFSWIHFNGVMTGLHGLVFSKSRLYLFQSKGNLLPIIISNII